MVEIFPDSPVSSFLRGTVKSSVTISESGRFPLHISWAPRSVGSYGLDRNVKLSPPCAQEYLPHEAAASPLL